MISHLFTALAAMSLVANASAQQQPPTVNLLPVSNLQYGSYDFDEGFTATNGANRQIGPDLLFDTIPGAAYYYASVSNPDKQELMDSLHLPNRGLSGEEQVNGMTWNYCEAGSTSYFDAYVSLYRDTVACIGPSVWVPGQPSFADCLYGVNNLPGMGCWQVTIDLSGGFECTLPDSTNPQSGPEGSTGWSVTPLISGSPAMGNIIHAGPPPPGSQPIFEWRDWKGTYFGSYVYGGCFGGGGSHIDFKVALYGTAVDVQYCHGSNPLDTLTLCARDNPENGAPWRFSVTGVGGAGRFFLLIQPDGIGGTDVCDQVTMAGNGGNFTRQVSLSGARPHSLGVRTGDFSTNINVPANPVDARVLFQVACFPLTGPIAPANVGAASNGINTTL
jgi:hypothetical protein